LIHGPTGPKVSLYVTGYSLDLDVEVLGDLAPEGVLLAHEFRELRESLLICCALTLLYCCSVPGSCTTFRVVLR
jgi:hypothetical protein